MKSYTQLHEVLSVSLACVRAYVFGPLGVALLPFQPAPVTLWELSATTGVTRGLESVVASGSFPDATVTSAW